MDKNYPRRGISRIEVLLCMLVFVVALGLTFVWAQRSRMAPNRIECVNNLKNLGQALHSYHVDFGSFPSEAAQPSPNLYMSLNAYFEDQSSPSPFLNPPRRRAFLCPSRRNVSVGPKRDYGYGGTKEPGSVGTSVLDAPVPVNMKTSGNVSWSNVAFLSHVWMDPKHYEGGDPTDLGWITLNNSRSCNTNFLDGNPAGSTKAIGSPHPYSSPFLFADGHVQNIPYTWTEHLPKIWAIEQSQNVTLP